MRTTILAALTATTGLLFLAFISRPQGVWKLSPTDDRVAFFLQLEESAAGLTGQVWFAGASTPLRVEGVERNGIQLSMSLPASFSVAPAGTLHATLGPGGTLLRARLAGQHDVRLSVEQSQHRKLTGVIASSVRERAGHLADQHLSVLANGSEDERRHAATQLAGGGLEIIPFLLNSVAKSDGSWSPWAVLTLDSIGPEAVEPLRRALHYENELVARVAAQALARLACASCDALEDLELVARSHSDAEVRRAAREALRATSPAA